MWTPTLRQWPNCSPGSWKEVIPDTSSWKWQTLFILDRGRSDLLLPSARKELPPNVTIFTTSHHPALDSAAIRCLLMDQETPFEPMVVRPRPTAHRDMLVRAKTPGRNNNNITTTRDETNHQQQHTTINIDLHSSSDVSKENLFNLQTEHTALPPAELSSHQLQLTLIIQLIIINLSPKLVASSISFVVCLCSLVLLFPPHFRQHYIGHTLAVLTSCSSLFHLLMKDHTNRSEILSIVSTYFNLLLLI